MAALRFAAAEARLRRARLRVVHAWRHPLSSYMGIAFEPPGPNLDPSALEGAASEAVDRALAELGREIEGIELERVVTEGPAAQVLLDQAATGELLMVGSRGHGGFSGLMLGSVSQQLVELAGRSRRSRSGPHAVRILLRSAGDLRSSIEAWRHSS